MALSPQQTDRLVDAFREGLTREPTKTERRLVWPVRFLALVLSFIPSIFWLGPAGAVRRQINGFRRIKGA